jgi:soluble lytic murein transglycosylase
VARDQLGATRRSARWLHPSPRPARLEAAAAAAGLDADLLRAVVRRESAFRPEVRSAAGAEGLAQLLPATARRLGTLAGLADDEPLRLGDPDVSLGLGAHYLGLLADRLGDEAVVLAGYNAGPAAAAGWAQVRAGRPLDEWVESIPYRETRAYVKGVLSAREVYRRLAGRPPGLDPDRPIPAPRGGVLF